MLRSKYLIASGVLAMTLTVGAGAANAGTIVQFDVQGTSGAGPFSGTFDVDETTPAVINVSINFPALSFFDVFAEITSSPDTLQFTNSANHNYTLVLDIDEGSLSDFADTPIIGGSGSGPNGFAVGDFSGGITETPLAATLPLFATGLGAMGLFGWRRKRKSQSF